MLFTFIASIVIVRPCIRILVRVDEDLVLTLVVIDHVVRMLMLTVIVGVMVEVGFLDFDDSLSSCS